MEQFSARLFLALLVIFFLQHGSETRFLKSSRRPSLFIVDLDAPPKQRWLPVLQNYKNDVIPRIAEMARSFVPAHLRPIVFGALARLVHLLPLDYGEEIVGMAEYLRSNGISLGELVAFNVLYDLTDFSHSPLSNANQSLKFVSHSQRRLLGCTSIVAAGRDGKVFHARNLDYELTQLLKDATILVDFVRAGKIQYTSVSFVLFVGVITGQKPDAFTISLNARYQGNAVLNILMELITRFHHPVALELRRTLEMEPDYVSALARLSWVPMVAPSYLVLGGTRGDGALISRDRLGEADVLLLDYRHHRWFLFETNFDHWKRAGDKRRKYGRKYMRQLGQKGLAPQTLFQQVLAKPPIRNGLTISSSVMSAEEPQLIYNWTMVWGGGEIEESQIGEELKTWNRKRMLTDEKLV